jgi:Raf kinase inhibitor-like YbhB/YbcL family protein
MLEKLPSGLGHALKALRPGPEKLLMNDRAVTGAAAALTVTSPAFAEGAALPSRYTADGEKLSPPLAWSGVPDGTAAVVLVIEDADSPTPHPLVHAIVHDLKPGERQLAEGALPGPAGRGEARAMGRNSFLGAAYLPPDPPPGHGPHRYAFEVFALDARPTFAGPPGRGDLVGALRGHVIAKGGLIGTYERS